MDYTLAYTPDQVAKMLQLSTNTVYDLIDRGQIVAKKIGKVYRVSTPALSYFLNGLDVDLVLAEREDLKNIGEVETVLSDIRKTL